MEPLCGGITPFRGLLALLFVLLKAGDVLVGEEEAVGGQGGGDAELEDGFAEGDWVSHGERGYVYVW
jgi:hypothetical protein